MNYAAFFAAAQSSFVVHPKPPVPVLNKPEFNDVKLKEAISNSDEENSIPRP